MRVNLWALLGAVLLWSVAAAAFADTCDADGNGFVAITDVRAIAAARNQPALPGDPRDGDGDGLITVLDARACALQCENARCAPVELATVPDVVGLPQGAAEAAIAGAGLSVGAISTTNSDTVPAGNVVSQAPTGGANVPVGSAVELVISLGPQLVTVPDVVGLPQADAELAVADAGLVVGTVTTAFNEEVPAGNVIDQDPPAGAQVPEARLVDLLVSLGSATVDEAEAIAEPPVVELAAESEITCVAFNEDGEEIVPTPSFSIGTVAPGVINGGNLFSASEGGDYDVTCLFLDSGIEGVVTVQVLPEETDPSLSSITQSFEDADSLAQALLDANEAEDIPALQVTKDALVDLIAEIAGTPVAQPLPADADRPTEQELLDAGDVPNPVEDAALATVLTDLVANFNAAQALLDSFDTGDIQQADIDALNALTTAAEALTDQLEALDPSVTGILANNDELNLLVSTLLPQQTASQAQELVDLLLTIPEIVQAVPQDFWRLQDDGPDGLYAQFGIDRTTPDAFYLREQRAFSLIGLATSRSIASSLRSQMIKRVYKPIWKAWKKAAQFIKDNSLDQPSGPGAPEIFLLLPTALSASGGQIIIDGTGFVPGNTQVKILANKGGPFFFELAASGETDSFAVASYGAFPFSCSFFSPCTAVISVVTPFGESNTIGRSIF